MKKMVVIGAGVTGLAFAKSYGPCATVYEASLTPGGKAGSYVVKLKEGDFHFDIGGHWFHHQGREDVLRLLDGLDLRSHHRRAFVQMVGLDGKQLVPFPVQANYSNLGDEFKVERIHTELSNLPEQTPRNYDEMLRYSYGETLYDEFFGPYNRAMFGLDDLSVLSFTPTDTKRNVRVGNAKGYNGDFVYPAGSLGAGAIPRQLGQGVDVAYGYKLTQLYPHSRTAVFEFAGREVEVLFRDGMVSTIPLKQLADMTYGLPREFKQIAENLRWSPGRVLNLAVKKNHEQDGLHWCYYPDELFYRAGFYSEVERALAPEGYNTMYVEVSPKNMDVPVEDIIRNLISVGLLTSFEDVLHQDDIRLPFNYCISTPESEALREFYRKQGIYSMGRYGAWYWGSQHEDIISAVDLSLSLQSVSV